MFHPPPSAEPPNAFVSGHLGSRVDEMRRFFTGYRLPSVRSGGGDGSTWVRVVSRRPDARAAAVSGVRVSPGGVRLANAQRRSESESGRRRRRKEEEGGREGGARGAVLCGVASETSSEAQRRATDARMRTGRRGGADCGC